MGNKSLPLFIYRVMIGTLAELRTSASIATLFRNDKIITRRMRGIVRRKRTIARNFRLRGSLRICAFANFGRRLDARLFIPAALRLASSTSLFAHLIGRPLPLTEFALCRMIIYPNAPFFGDFTRPRERQPEE